MEYSKTYFEKIFSSKRMERYCHLYDDENYAIIHYQCNIELAESFYPCLSVLEVALRNALCRELVTMTGREDWYTTFFCIPGLSNLTKYITKASKQISGRREIVTPSKIVAELTLGFWVSLLNVEYEVLLWKHLRRAFPYMPKQLRQRKNVSTPLNSFRLFRNRVFHNESICWNMKRITEIHNELYLLMGWINKDLPGWVATIDRVEETKKLICNRMGWQM